MGGELQHCQTVLHCRTLTIHTCMLKLLKEVDVWRGNEKGGRLNRRGDRWEGVHFVP